MRALWISKNVPYDDVAHAVGKIHNFLLKFFISKDFDCYLVSFAKEDEFDKIDLDKYNIPYDVAKISFQKNLLYFGKKFFSLVFVITYLLGLDTAWYVWRILKAVLRYKRKNNEPDIVILQWTSVVNQIWWLKKIFPKSKFIAIEEDVTFLKKERILSKSSFLKKFFRKPAFAIFKKIELNSLKLSDLAVLNNEKDQELIVREGVGKEKTYVCHPFFQDMHYVNCNYFGKDILFYGAMNRPENYQSAIWFIEKVFSKLEPLGFQFIVVGNRPHDSLKHFDNGKTILVTGFVENVTPYFENSLCLVAPLVMGAGVKIKVIEAMSSGLPVLTNEIGIEGIPAKDGEEFFLCESPEEYVDKIEKLSTNAPLGCEMGKKAKEIIKKKFNYKNDAQVLLEKIKLIAECE